jgi:hypothetical protein
MADYRARTTLRGLLSGICPICDRMIYRAATLAKLDEIGGGLKVAFPSAQQRIDDTGSPFPKVHFNKVCDS